MVGQDGSNLGPFQINGNGLIHGVQDLDHNSGIHGFGFWVQHCVLLATTLYGLHTGWFGKTKLYGFLVAPVIYVSFWPWCWLLISVWLLFLWWLLAWNSTWAWGFGIYKKHSAHSFPCTKTQCTKSTCFNIALGASYSTECFLVLTSYTWNMLIASIYHAILLCAIEKFDHIYNQNHHTSLDIEKPKYLWYSKIMKNHHAGPFSHGLKCKKTAACWFF